MFFHFKYAPGTLENVINEFLNEIPDIEIFSVTQSINTNNFIILTIFYK